MSRSVSRRHSRSVARFVSKTVSISAAVCPARCASRTNCAVRCSITAFGAGALRNTVARFNPVLLQNRPDHQSPRPEPGGREQRISAIRSFKKPNPIFRWSVLDASHSLRVPDAVGSTSMEAVGSLSKNSILWISLSVVVGENFLSSPAIRTITALPRCLIVAMVVNSTHTEPVKA